MKKILKLLNDLAHGRTTPSEVSSQFKKKLIQAQHRIDLEEYNQSPEVKDEPTFKDAKLRIEELLDNIK